LPKPMPILGDRTIARGNGKPIPQVGYVIL
jgi:hypothetical protein